MKITAIAPGRVNLIGEHTDYNQGWVMPVAIDLKLTVKLTLRPDHLFFAAAFGYKERRTFNLEDLQPVQGKPDWIDYLKAVCWALEKNGYKLSGAELSIASEIPIGAGLSSSAALELAVAGALNKAFNLRIDPQNLALICQQAENEYIGVRCGIMDQYAIVLGRSGKALFLDCLSLDYSFVPFKLDQSKKNTLLGTFEKTKISFFKYNYLLIDKLEIFEGVKIAGIKDLIAMKIDAIATRGVKRDFIDLYFLCQKTDLIKSFSFYRKKYKGKDLNLLHAVRALTYFADANKDKMPEMLVDCNWQDIKKYFLIEAPKLLEKLLNLY